ncbi:MAG: hypothetical protein CMA64_09495 [Euryarchaeota archaeon]|jgi:hypothetical protein|nr:hypothetical protein [Euryarchaeota archaeon]
MPTVTRSHPATASSNTEMMGADMSFFTVDYVATNASTGPEGAQASSHKVIGNTNTIVAIGPMLDSNTQQTFAVEGSLDAATMQAAIRALGTVDGVDLSGATVTATKLGILTAAAVS